MAGRGGKREGAGRKVGATSITTKIARKTLSEIARDLAPDALNVVAQILNDATQTGSARIAAANVILDRAYGKAPQAVTLTGPNDGPVQIIDPTKVSTEALRELMAAMNAHPEADEG